MTFDPQELLAMWLACYTPEEIGEAVGLFQQDVAKAVEAQKMDSCPKSVKLLATYTDAEWKPPRSATRRATEDGAETGSCSATGIVSRTEQEGE